MMLENNKNSPRWPFQSEIYPNRGEKTAMIKVGNAITCPASTIPQLKRVLTNALTLAWYGYTEL